LILEVFLQGFTSYFLKITIIPNFDCKSPIREPTEYITVYIRDSDRTEIEIDNRTKNIFQLGFNLVFGSDFLTSSVWWSSIVDYSHQTYIYIFSWCNHLSLWLSVQLCWTIRTMRSPLTVERERNARLWLLDSCNTCKNGNEDCPYLLWQLVNNFKRHEKFIIIYSIRMRNLFLFRFFCYLLIQEGSRGK